MRPTSTISPGWTWRDGDRARDGRHDPRLAELGLVAGDGGARGVDARAGDLEVAAGLVEVVRGQDLLAGEVLAPAQGQLGQPRFRLRLRHLGLRFAQGGAQGIALELGQQVALADDAPFVHEEAHDAAGALRAHDHLSTRIGHHAAVRGHECVRVHGGRSRGAAAVAREAGPRAWMRARRPGRRRRRATVRASVIFFMMAPSD